MSTQSGRKIFDTETLKAIGIRIREARGGMTQEEFSSAIGVTRSALTNYEAGRRLPNDVILGRIAEVSGMSLPYIVFGSTVTPFELYKRRIDDEVLIHSQKRPGFIPKFMISDEEIAFISLFRVFSSEYKCGDILESVLNFAKEIIQSDSEMSQTPITWGQAYVELLERAVKRGHLEEGYDPDFSFWVTFGEEKHARKERLK